MRKEIEEAITEVGEFIGFLCPECQRLHHSKVDARECCDRAIDE